MDADLSFNALRGSWHWVTTMAYWLGPCRDFNGTDEELLQFDQEMSFNYDMEEQMECTGRVWAKPESRWYRDFRPITPVQLVKEWSPFPLALQLLGEPSQWAAGAEGTSCRPIVTFWDGTRIAEACIPPLEPAEKDAQRFISVLHLALQRARKEHWGLILCGRPGWSYDSGVPIGGSIAESMRSHGYVLTDRRPR
jgi:hypothetical protein